MRDGCSWPTLLSFGAAKPALRPINGLMDALISLVGAKEEGSGASSATSESSASSSRSASASAVGSSSAGLKGASGASVTASTRSLMASCVNKETWVLRKSNGRPKNYENKGK